MIGFWFDRVGNAPRVTNYHDHESEGMISSSPNRCPRDEMKT